MTKQLSRLHVRAGHCAMPWEFRRKKYTAFDLTGFKKPHGKGRQLTDPLAQ